MPAQILNVASGAADSSDVVVSAGTPLTVALKDAHGSTVEGTPVVEIKLKDDAGQYFLVGQLTQVDPVRVIVGPGTYKFSRTATSASCGVFSG